MGPIAHIQLECQHCGKKTDAYIEETGGKLNAKVKCEHCNKVFVFGPGMAYTPIGYVSLIPQWAKINDKKWWEFWK